ncbi:MAG: tRNA pseudouridine(55) synthase TruB, partial [Actinomycetota bacterium]
MAKPEGSQPVGIAVVDKAAGMTSHDVVGRARKVLHTRKVGHSGTLDPGATGVLLLGVGPATRLLRFLTDLPKTYTTEIVLGVETDTLDDSGETTARHDMAVDPAQVIETARTLTGDIEQVPPMVSAVKIDGRRLHELAREGKEVDRPPRPVTVHRFDTEPTDDPLVYRATVECSSGTYVRTLAEGADAGAAQVAQVRSPTERRAQVGGQGA